MRHWAPGGHLAASASGCIGGGLLVAPQFRGRVWRLCGGSLTFPTSLQMGTNKCASQSGMTAYGTRRHLYDPKNHILPPMDHLTISLQLGTNKCDSQVGTTAPGTRWHIYNTKLGTDKCDNSSMSLQMGYMQGANQSG